MLSLNQTTGYAITALGLLNGPSGVPVQVKDIAQATGIPRAYLAKLVHDLQSKGLVATRRGYRGGVVLARPADQISLIDVAEAVSGKTFSVPCLLGMRECSDEHACPLHHLWKETVSAIHAGLSRTTLEEAASFRCIHARVDPPPAQEPAPAAPAAGADCDECSRQERCNVSAPGRSQPKLQHGRK
jgi:Rrf2 family protein